VSDDLLEQLVEQIRPRPDCKAACREKARKYIAGIRSIRQFADPVSSTAIRAEVEKFRRALQKVRDMAPELSPAARALLFITNDEYEFFFKVWGDVIDWGCSASLIPVRKQAPSKRLSKMAAAGFARKLMENYSDYPPRLTKGGAFFGVASLLFEGATGEQNADLTDYCRSSHKLAHSPAKTFVGA
jgi:hypothetical protein